MYPWQDGADLDKFSAFLDKLIANFVIIVVLAIVVTILLIAASVLVYLWRRPKGAQNPMSVLLGTLNELVQQLKDQEQRAQTERTSFAAMIAESTAVLKRMADWQDGSKDRHEIYTDGFRVAVKQIAEDLGKANTELAEQGRTHTTDALTAQFGAARQEVKQTVTDELHRLNEEMERRASANGEAFTALQTGLNNLKAEVIALAAATGQEHAKTRKDLLAKIDALTRIVTDMAKAPQGSEKSTHVENSAPAENVGTSKEPPPPAKSAPKEPKEGI